MLNGWKWNEDRDWTDLRHHRSRTSWVVTYRHLQERKKWHVVYMIEPDELYPCDDYTEEELRTMLYQRCLLLGLLKLPDKKES